MMLLTALAGLSADERAELLALLESRERLAAEAPRDDREPMEEIVKRLNAETAASLSILRLGLLPTRLITVHTERITRDCRKTRSRIRAMTLKLFCGECRRQ